MFFDGGANNPQKYNGIGTSAEITYDFGPVMLTSITRLRVHPRLLRAATSTAAIRAARASSSSRRTSQDGLDYLHQYTQEIHLATDTTGPWFWQVGGFWFDTDYQDQTYPFFVPPTFVRQTNTSYALFGQSSYKLTDALKLTGGVRWTSDVKGMTANGRLHRADHRRRCGSPATISAGTSAPITR